MKANSQHPYFIIPALEELRTRRNELSDQRVAELKRQIVLNAPDREAAALYADLQGDDWANIYPPAEQPAPVTTDSAIDIFMETYGKQSAEETALLERLIFNPIPEYAEMLEKEEDRSATPAAPADEQDALIAAFINSGKGTSEPDEEIGELPIEISIPTPAPIAEPQKDEEAASEAEAQVPKEEPRESETKSASTGSSTLSESLAKIFIKQGRYERAYEIISDLNLNYPEKSVYFADQLRFLQKLIKIKEGRATSEK